MTITLPISGSPNWDTPLNTALLNLQSQAQSAQTTANGAVTSLASKVATDALVYNVKDHGAAGNNSTDDTVAIQATINLASTNGGIVFFPVGIYKISSSLTVASNVTFQGCGPTSVISQNSTTSDIFTGTDVQNITFDSLKLQGPGSGTGNGIRLTISVNLVTTRPVIRKLIIQSMGGDGVNISAPVYGHISDSAASSCGGYGFDIFGVTSLASTFVFTNCYANACTLGGYRIFKGININLTGCYALACVVGFLINVCTGTVLNNCFGDGCATGVKVNTGSSNAIFGYYSNNNTGIGIQITGPTLSASIHKAVDVSPNASATHFIQVDSGSYATIISCINVTSNLFSGTVNVLDDGTTGTLTSSGNLKIGTAGNTLFVKEGTNAKMGVSTLVAGTVVVPTTAVTATSRIMLTGQNASGTAGSLGVSARTAGTSFTILSTSSSDTRQVAWLILEPA